MRGRETIAPAVGHPQFAMQALLRADRRSRARRSTLLGDAAAHGRERLRLRGACGRRAATDRWQTSWPAPISPRRSNARSTTLARDRSRQCRGGGARHRGRAARGRRDAGQDRGAGHARPRAGAPRARGAGALERRGRRFRRRCARRHAGRRVRAARRRGGARRPCAGDAARLLKHPLLRLGAAAGAHARAIAALERAVLRGPRPRPGTAGLAARARDLPRRACASCGAGADPTCIGPIRAPSSRCRARCGRRLVARLAAALRRWRRCRARRARSPTSRPATARCRSARAPSERRRRRFRGRRRRRRWPPRSTRSRPCDRAGFRRGAGRLCRAVPRRRSPTAWCAGRACRACACASTACSKRGCRTSTASCSAAWSKASGRRRRAPIPGSAGRCATRSASICRSGASGCRRTTSRRRWAPSEVILSLSPPSLPARRRCLALRAAARRGRGRAALERRARRAARAISTGRARSIGRPRCKRIKQPAPKPPRAARPTALSVTEIEHLAARSLHDLRQARAQAARARSRSTLPPGARRPRHRDPRRARRVHQDLRGRAAGRSRRRADRDRRASTSRRSTTIPEARAFWWPRFERIARWFAGWERGAARRRLQRCTPRSAARSRSRSASATFTLRARADRIERLRRRPLRHPRLQDRHACRPRSRCASASRRSSRSKPRSCAAAASPASPRAARSRELAYVRAQGRRAAGRAARRSTSRTATPTSRPTRALAQAQRAGRRASRTSSSRICSLVLSDVEEPLRRLRPSRAREGMVGRPAAMTRTTRGGGGMNAPRIIPPTPCCGCRSRRPTRRCRPGSRPMPARARPTCWRSA